jgi:hypothetical protein
LVNAGSETQSEVGVIVGVTIGGKPLAGFDQPIELLKDCHRRVEHFLDVLQKVVALFGEGHLSEEGRRALQTSLDYFEHAAPRHTADEEQSLFPRMRRSSDAQDRAVMAELERLESDHRHAEVCHAQVDELEEEGVFVAAAKMLEPGDFGEVGVEMRRRRFGN